MNYILTHETPFPKNRPTARVIWKLGPLTLTQHHDPRLLLSGNLLIFERYALARPYVALFTGARVDPRTTHPGQLTFAE